MSIAENMGTFPASSACINEIISLNIGKEFRFIHTAALTRKLP